MKRRRLALVAAALASVAALALSVSSCVGDGGNEMLSCPSQHVFIGETSDGGPAAASVSEFMSRRCGTLDCHGNDQRPMRIYGQFGLREPAESNVSGGKPTTLAELKANYATVCGLEPEKTDQAVMDQGQSAEQLAVVLKSRNTEPHKGGPVVKQGDHGDNCIAGWLRGDPPDMVASECQAALDAL